MLLWKISSPKIQTYDKTIPFSSTNHERDSLGGTSTTNTSFFRPLLTKIQAHCKYLKNLLKAITTASTAIASFTATILNVIYNYYIFDFGIPYYNFEYNFEMQNISESATCIICNRVLLIISIGTLLEKIMFNRCMHLFVLKNRKCTMDMGI